MTSAIGVRIPGTYAGPEVNTMPVLWAGRGADGCAHRFLAENQGAVGSTNDLIYDTIGSSLIYPTTSAGVAGAAGNKTVIAADGGYKVVRHDQTTDTAVADYLGSMTLANIPVADMKSITLIFRFRAGVTPVATNQNIFRSGGGTLFRTALGDITLTKLNPSNAPKSVTITKAAHPDCDPTTQYVVMTVVGGGAAAGNALAVNGTFAPMVMDVADLLGNSGLFGMGGLNMPMDWLELSFSNRYLTEADTDAMYAQAKLNYPGLVL